MMKRLYLIIYIIGCCTLALHAQKAEDQLRNIYDNAEQEYNIGRLEEARQMLSDKGRRVHKNAIGGKPIL